MSDHLFVRPLGMEARATIIALNEAAELIGAPETLALTDLAARAGEARITVLLPAQEVIGCLAAVPATSAARQRQMLPFALEDEFVGNVEDLHFAAGGRTDDGQLAISVIEKRRLEQWLAHFESFGIVPRQVYSEGDAVPNTPGTVTLFLDGASTLGRRPGGAPFAFDELGLPDLWALLAAEAADQADLDNVVLFADPATLQMRESEIEVIRAAVDSLEIKQLADGALPHLAANLIRQPGINLLQGQYAPRSNYAALARPWRMAAAMLVVWLGAILVGEAAAVFKLSRDEARLTAAIESVCAADYQSAAINNCRLEMLRRLQASGQSTGTGEAGYLATLAVVAEASGAAVTMESMSYREGVLNLVFLAPNAPFVDAFAESVSASGRFQVIDPSTSAEPNGVRTRLRIAPVVQ